MAKKEPKDESIVLLKVSNKRKSIYIEYQQGADTIARNFHDNPLPSFYKALEALAPHVCTLAELPAKDADKITPTGVTFRHKGDNTMATVTARKPIKKGKRILNLSTPILAMYEDSENAGADHMEKEEARAIDKVLSETIKYLSGERAQGQINFTEEGDDPEAGDDEKPKGEELPFDPGADKTGTQA